MKQIKFLLSNKKFLLLSLYSFLTIQLSFGQGGAGDAKRMLGQFKGVVSDLKTDIFDTVYIACTIIVAVLAIAFGVKLFSAVQSGDGDTSKKVTSYFAALILFYVIVTLVKLLYIDNI